MQEGRANFEQKIGKGIELEDGLLTCCMCGRRKEGFEWGSHSSSSGKNKLNEPPLDADNSTVDEDDEYQENRKRLFGANNQHYFNNAEFEVADILLNLDTYFLERVNLENLDGTVNSNSSYVNTPTDQVRFFSNSTFQNTVNLGVSHIRKQRKRSVNETAFELPQNFKNVICDMGGSRITLLIEKTLYKSDLDRQENHLSIPSTQVKDREFLLSTRIGEMRGNQSEIDPTLTRNHRMVKWSIG
ncbi:hypothetical protein PIB30_085268, partial [Stylosanthes scabra]|nr:hypothetical protein [Stylosanthes scabra]